MLNGVAARHIAALFLAHEDPFGRNALCAGTGFRPTAIHAKAWNKILYDLGVGALISLSFYWLVVRLPDYQRRQRIKKSSSKSLQEFSRRLHIDDAHGGRWHLHVGIP